MIYCQKKISGANPSMVPIMGVLIFRGAKYPRCQISEVPILWVLKTSMTVFECTFVVFVLVHVFVYVCTCVYVFVYVIVYSSFLYCTCVNVYVNHEYILVIVSLCMCIWIRTPYIGPGVYTSEEASTSSLENRVCRKEICSARNCHWVHRKESHSGRNRHRVYRKE